MATETKERTMQIQQIFVNDKFLINTKVKVSGWVKTCRKQKQMIFIRLSDGTHQDTLQIVATNDMVDYTSITTGTSLEAWGTLVSSPASGQTIELQASEVVILQQCDRSFPFQKAGLSIDFVRTYPHLRYRTNLMRAAFVVKSRLLLAIHKFMAARNFFYVDLPAITTNACEGGCEPLQVTSLLKSKSGTMDLSRVDYSEDFFGTEAYLTVSNQLHLETAVHGMGNVYTITPATRGEPSQTSRHLAHFNMLEVEFCFCDLNENIYLAESLIQLCIRTVMAKCEPELKVLDAVADSKLLTKLNKIVSEPFERITHHDAIVLLREHHMKSPFDDEPKFDSDLSSAHEKFLVTHFAKPVVVTHYPRDVKAFYMPVSKTFEHEGKTIEYVDCFDILMDIGEVVGGSQRIWKHDDLVANMKHFTVDESNLDWYLSLRKYGSVPHGGFGIGIERLTSVITGLSNVKDSISFPLTIGHCVY